MQPSFNYLSRNLSTQVPSVWSNLKEGMKVDIKSTEFDKDKFWGILYGSGMDKCLTDLGVILRNVDTKIVNIRYVPFIKKITIQFQKSTKNDFMIRWFKLSCIVFDDQSFSY